MKNELLKIGPFTVYGYGLMIAIGILAAYVTGEYRTKKRKLPYEHVFYLAVWCVLGGFVGAKLLILGDRMGKHSEEPGISGRHSDRWFCSVWGDYWRNFHCLDLLQD